MALQIQESFEVHAPIDAVWAFLNDPANVVACMPGASLTEIVDASRFVGAVKLKIGAVSAQYQGTITYAEANRDDYSVKMIASGNERGGGTVSGTILTRLETIPGSGATRVSCTSSIDLTGRIIQVGRGMIEGVSAQIIKQYVGNVRALLEAPAAAADAATAGATAAAPPTPGAAPAAPAKADSINVLAVLLKVLRERIGAFFRRLVGRA